MVVRLLAVVVALAWQLAVAAPAQARPGDLDPSFGGGGTVTSDFPGLARGLVVQGGKLVAAGLTFSSETGDDFGLARYNANGRLDRSFGTGGTVTTDITPSGSPDEANALIQQADGKLVAAGVTLGPIGAFDFALARYSPDGALDPSFGTGGIVSTDIAGSLDFARALVQQADGKLVAAGRTDTATGTDFGLARYNPDGTLDASFGTSGTVTTDIGGGDDFAHALAVQADGKLVAAGVAPTQTGSSFALARYNPDGTLDPSFGTGGTVTTDLIGGANALVVQADGKLVAAGAAGNDFGLARYNPNGALDLSFGIGGVVTTDFAGGSDSAFALAVQADGKLVAAGGDGSGFALARYRTR